jgi:6-phosphogluconolactonase
MSIHRHVASDARGAAEAAARQARTLLEAALGGQAEATMAISGGSTPALMFDALSQMDIDWSSVHIFWVDERDVPPGDPLSNYSMAEHHLLAPARIPRRNIHRIHAEEGAREAARQYCEHLRLRFGGIPHFDVVQLGIGADAHTASLFPGEKLVDDREGLAAAVFVDVLDQWRTTLLPGVLLAAQHTLVLATGEEKAPAIRDVLEGPYDPRRLPAQIISHHGRRVHWFLDTASARLLS